MYKAKQQKSLTIDQSNLAKATSNPPLAVGGIKTPA